VTANIAPRMLSHALVTIPAKSSATPNARTIGQAVGAGTFMAADALSRVSV